MATEDQATPVTDLSLPSQIGSVVLHPLVLLSIQDHAARAVKGTKKRVIGILLGQDLGGGRGVNVANSFAGTSRSFSLEGYFSMIRDQYHPEAYVALVSGGRMT